MEDDDELVFEFRLARDLGMTVARMRTEMDRSEFLLWSRWYSMWDQAIEVANGGG